MSSFVEIDPSIDYFRADCTIFNYDIVVLLTSSGPYLFECSIGGYIPPAQGGRINNINFDKLKQLIIDLKPKKIIIPEAYVNNYYPEFKKFIYSLDFPLDKFIVFIQKEQNFYYKEIHDVVDWFYEYDNIPNITYHSIGHNVPKEDENFKRFKEFNFCKQGFLCETFSKLYNLKDTTFDKEWEKRNKREINPYNLIFYGNLHTSIRPTIFEVLNDSKTLSLKDVHYGDESLTNLVLDHKGILVSMDGLVYNTIRDVEAGINVTPSIKITRANDYVIEKNNVTMFGTRKLCKIEPRFFEVKIDKKETELLIRQSIDEYMENEFTDYNKSKRQAKYHFFITLLQKFYNVEFFIFDILFNEKLQEFLDNIPLDINFEILGKCADADALASYNKDILFNDFVLNVYDIFNQKFKELYLDWYNN